MVIRVRKWVKLFFVVLILVLLFLGIRAGIDAYEAVMYPKKYTDCVEQYAEKFGVDENLIYAVIKTESGFQPEAVSNQGAKGLMQITKDTFQWIGTKLGDEAAANHDDLFQPEIGVKYGVFLLDYLLDEFGDYKVVLSAYHAGRGITNTWLEDKQYSSDGKTLDVIPYSDTQHYVNKVLKNYEKYVKIYGEAKPE